MGAKAKALRELLIPPIAHVAPDSSINMQRKDIEAILDMFSEIEDRLDAFEVRFDQAFESTAPRKPEHVGGLHPCGDCTYYIPPPGYTPSPLDDPPHGHCGKQRGTVGRRVYTFSIACSDFSRRTP
jgi:hypothetical protein